MAQAAFYDTPAAAAHAAFKEAQGMKRGKSEEYATFIVKSGNSNKFYYTPLQIGSEDNDELRVSIPRGDSVAGLFHTHTIQSAKNFSPTDIDVADSMKLPSYMGHVPSGVLQVYNPSGKLGARTSVVPDPPAPTVPPPPVQQAPAGNTVPVTTSAPASQSVPTNNTVPFLSNR